MRGLRVFEQRVDRHMNQPRARRRQWHQARQLTFGCPCRNSCAFLCGFRGQPPGDLEACIDAICCVAEFAEEHWESLVELDINPLMVRPEGKGVMAADALIRMEHPAGNL